MGDIDRVHIVAMGRPSDPLLEGILRSEGYQLVHKASLGEALADGARERAAVIAILVGEKTRLQAPAVITEAARQLPDARFLVVAPGTADHDPAPPDGAELSDRVTWISGDVGVSENPDRVRRFLRGDGYRWASDLGKEGAPQEETASSDEAKVIRRFAADLSHFTALRPMLQEALSRCTELLHCDAGSIDRKSVV